MFLNHVFDLSERIQRYCSDKSPSSATQKSESQFRNAFKTLTKLSLKHIWHSFPSISSSGANGAVIHQLSFTLDVLRKTEFGRRELRVNVKFGCVSAHWEKWLSSLPESTKHQLKKRHRAANVKGECDFNSVRQRNLLTKFHWFHQGGERTVFCFVQREVTDHANRYWLIPNSKSEREIRICFCSLRQMTWTRLLFPSTWGVKSVSLKWLVWFRCPLTVFCCSN